MDYFTTWLGRGGEWGGLEVYVSERERRLLGVREAKYWALPGEEP